MLSEEPMAETFTKMSGVFSRPRAWLLVALAFVGLLVLVIYALPLLLVRSDGGTLTAAERLKAENDVRTTLVQALAGAILLAGLYFTARTLQVSTRTLEVNREGQITERFTRAIDQLGQPGSEKLDVRLGGIYALERIAKGSKEDHGPIMDVLTAFLREHARWQPGEATRTEPASAVPRSEPGSVSPIVQPRADVQAVVTVLGRRNRDFDERGGSLDLSGVDLRRANLRGAHFEGASLHDSHLEDADLGGAYLTGASLRKVHLERAILLGIHLEAADLGDAHLEGVSLRGAHLEEAALGGAHLEGADLGDAHLAQAFLAGACLRGVNLSYADLEGAFLPGADLDQAVLYATRLDGADLGNAHLDGADISSADLSRALGLRRTQLDGAKKGESTILPLLP
jgi:uncharacterized protein YjbI with pentapeptide repeats